MFNHLSLFAGAGMTDLAAEYVGATTVAWAEPEPFCSSIMRARFPDAEEHGYVRNIRPDSSFPPVDLISGGFPCQDISGAGLGAGIEGARSGLWGHFARLVEELGPRFVLAENVALLRSRGLNRVVSDLATLGYSVRWDCILARSVGAPHLRDRIWVRADRDPRDDWNDGTRVASLSNIPSKLPRSGSVRRGSVYERPPLASRRASNAAARSGKALLRTPIESGTYANLPWPTATRRDYKDTGDLSRVPDKSLLPRRVFSAEGSPTHNPAPLNPEWVEWLMGVPCGWTDPELPNARLGPLPSWESEPNGIPRIAHGVPARADRIRALGNGLVPQVAAYVLNELLLTDPAVRATIPASSIYRR